MLLNCREVLKELFHATDAGAVQGRNDIRSCAADLGVKRYKAKGCRNGQTIWRTAGELAEDCGKAKSLASKSSLPSLFDRQLRSREAFDGVS